MEITRRTTRAACWKKQKPKQIGLTIARVRAPQGAALKSGTHARLWYVQTYRTAMGLDVSHPVMRSRKPQNWSIMNTIENLIAQIKAAKVEMKGVATLARQTAEKGTKMAAGQHAQAVYSAKLAEAALGQMAPNGYTLAAVSEHDEQDWSERGRFTYRQSMTLAQRVEQHVNAAARRKALREASRATKAPVGPRSGAGGGDRPCAAGCDAQGGVSRRSVARCWQFKPIVERRWAFCCPHVEAGTETHAAGERGKQVMPNTQQNQAAYAVMVRTEDGAQESGWRRFPSRRKAGRAVFGGASGDGAWMVCYLHLEPRGGAGRRGGDGSAANGACG